MSAKSEKQRRAMYAAAAGHSKIGIPQAVGKEFVKAPGKPQASQLAHRAAAKGFRRRVKEGYK